MFQRLGSLKSAQALRDLGAYQNWSRGSDPRSSANGNLPRGGKRAGPSGHGGLFFSCRFSPKLRRDRESAKKPSLTQPSNPPLIRSSAHNFTCDISNIRRPRSKKPSTRENQRTPRRPTNCICGRLLHTSPYTHRVRMTFICEILKIR